MTEEIVTRGDKIGMYIIIGIVITLIVVTIVGMVVVTDVFGSKGGKGLKVFLTVNSNYERDHAGIGTFQFGNTIEQGAGWINNGVTTMTVKYDKGEVQTGDFQICIRLTNGIQSCGSGYNSESKEPTHVTVNLYRDVEPQPSNNGNDQSQSQSSSNNNENNNALSQSQETTIYICKEGACTAQ